MGMCMGSKNISKSRFVNYLQCPKKLWLQINHPEYADELDQTVFANGTMVGELAQGIFPGGALVEFDSANPDNIAQMIASTARFIEQGEQIIYEAAFGREGILAICDILRVHDVEGQRVFDIYEVKSSTECKDVYVQDVAFQKYVLETCNIPVRDCYVVYITKGYKREGELDLNKLFTIERVTESATELQEKIPFTLNAISQTLGETNEPDNDIGAHCDKPYTCEFKGHCWHHIPTNSVFDISFLGTEAKHRFYQEGIISFQDVVDNDVPLKPHQRMQVDAELQDVEYFDQSQIKKFLDTLYYPLCYLDFETFMPPVPLYQGTVPYQQVPSQYSLHIIREEGGQIEHRDFLAKEGVDPRYRLATKLVDDIPGEACIVAYNMSFERGVIANLARQFPALEQDLMRIHGSFVDLMEPFKRKDYYHRRMHGSYSIKYVLPALFPDDPELSYESLGLVSNGGQAMAAYATLTDLPEEQRAPIRQALLEYCRLDTLAMVKIVEKLKEWVVEA